MHRVNVMRCEVVLRHIPTNTQGVIEADCLWVWRWGACIHGGGCFRLRLCCFVVGLPPCVGAAHDKAPRAVGTVKSAVVLVGLRGAGATGVAVLARCLERVLGVGGVDRVVPLDRLLVFAAFGLAEGAFGGVGAYSINRLWLYIASRETFRRRSRQGRVERVCRRRV